MIYQDIVTLLSKRKQQVYRKEIIQDIPQMMIAMISGFAIGLTVASCFTQKSERQPHKKFKKKSQEAAETVMNTVENIQNKTESVKENIKSGYEDFMRGAQEVADDISGLNDKTPE